MDSSAGHGHQGVEPTASCHHSQQFHHRSSALHHHHHFHHHHHYFRANPHCPLHSYMLRLKNHSPACPGLASSHPQSQNPETLDSVPFPKDPLNFQASQSKDAIFENPLVMDEGETFEVEEGKQQEEEEDPIFVLTDEWRDFFAKSEAKRRLAKQQSKKKAKNQTKK